MNRSIYENYDDVPVDIKHVNQTYFEYPLHFHEALELVFCTRGTVRYEINETVFDLRCGDAALIFPHFLHRVLPLEDNNDREFYVFMISGSVYTDIPFLYHSTMPQNPVISAEPVTALLEEIRKLWQENDVQLLPHYLKILLIRLTRGLSLTQRTDGNAPDTDKFVSEMSRYITTHYREPLTLSDVASAIGINKYRASRLLNAITQSSFSDILNNYRLIAAERLLTSTDMRVSEIADACGFGSFSTFHRVFKKYYHTSPAAFRENYVSRGTLPSDVKAPYTDSLKEMYAWTHEKE